MSVSFVNIFLILLSGKVQGNEESDALLRNTNSKTCRKMCWNGNNCSRPGCAGCFFSCPAETCRVRQTSCRQWCNKKSQCSTEYACRGCVFCSNVKKSCPLATFKRDRDIFNKEVDGEYWYQWLHSGKPYFHSGPPVFFDINNDNNLDYFNPMHGHPTALSGSFENRVELGIGTRNETGQYSLRQYSDRIVCNDTNCGQQMVDAHASIVMDLNGDGISDIYISNGGGNQDSGQFENSRYDNWLFWGETFKDIESGDTFTKFVGGREEARKANVEMQLGRGRFNYIFDANNDGLLDIFSSQDRAVGNIISPGVLLINQGNNKWKEEEGMKEFSRTMILTDADGDGLAQEFLIQRSYCYPARQGPGVDETKPELGPYQNDVKAFCHTRPVGTPVVYRYSSSTKAMEQISRPYKNFWAGRQWTNSCCLNGAWSNGNDCNAVSMVSGDFDDDQIADHILLYESKMRFFFSSDRQRGALPDSSEYIGLEIKLPSYCHKAYSIHLLDIDNNGKEEILVACTSPGVYLLYSRGVRKIDWTLDNGCNGKAALGALSNRFEHIPTEEDMTDFCSAFDDYKWSTKKTTCDKFYNNESFTQASGLSIIDVNNDGFRDIVAINSFGNHRFFINKPTDVTSRNEFIGFRVVGDVLGSENNRFGIGATIIFSAEDTNGNIVKQFREINSSQHHTDQYGSKDDRMVFGLGQNLRPKSLLVRWPNGFTQLSQLSEWTFSNVFRPIDIYDIKRIFELGWTNLKTTNGLCLSVEGESSDVKILPCEKGKVEMKWKMNHKGFIFSEKEPSHCLYPNIIDKGTVLGITSPCNHSWLLTQNQQLRYGASLFVLDLNEVSSDQNASLSPIHDQTKVLTKWNFQSFEEENNSTPSLMPSSEPSLKPSSDPSAVPSFAPSSLTSFPSSQPSLKPSSDPSAVPSFAPSSDPSASPNSTFSCNDVDGNFMIGKNVRDCNWVSKRKQKRCSRLKLRNKCPDTCDICD